MTQRANAYQKEKMVLCMYNFVILGFATQESGNKTVDYNILKDNLTRKPPRSLAGKVAYIPC
jgi:hypothetical protein